MNIPFEQRPSDSAYVEKVWRSRAEKAGAFTSLAASHWEMVVTRIMGRTIMTVRGPETKATPAFSPAGAEFFGIRFKFGTFMPHFPVRRLIDRNDVNLPGASSKSFWLCGDAWEFPSFDNADTFVERLVREGLVVREPLVDATLKGHLSDISLRSTQRRFVQATGLTHGGVRQIERARHATMLLQQGMSILDTVEEAGYFDQPHLTRSLRHFVGRTPAQLASHSSPEPLSFLYKTSIFL